MPDEAISAPNIGLLRVGKCVQYLQSHTNRVQFLSRSARINCAYQATTMPRCACSQRNHMDCTYSSTSAVRSIALGALVISAAVRLPLKDGGSSHTKRSCSGGNPGCTAFLRIHRAGEVTLRGPSLRIRPTGALLPPIGLIGRRAYRGAGRRRHPPAAR